MQTESPARLEVDLMAEVRALDDKIAALAPEVDAARSEQMARVRRLMRKHLAEGSLAVEKVKHGRDWSDRASFPDRYRPD